MQLDESSFSVLEMNQSHVILLLLKLCSPQSARWSLDNRLTQQTMRGNEDTKPSDVEREAYHLIG